MKRIIFALMVVLGMVTVTTLYADGYQSNGAGGTYGTGSNAGGGYQSNGAGGFYGTGNNAGQHCQSNGAGGLNCN